MLFTPAQNLARRSGAISPGLSAIFKHHVTPVTSLVVRAYNTRGYGFRQPLHDDRKPGYAQRTPSSSNRSPGYASRSPGFVNRSPGYDNRSSVYGSQGGYKSQKPDGYRNNDSARNGPQVSDRFGDSGKNEAPSKNPATPDLVRDEEISSSQVVIPLSTPEGSLTAPLPLPSGWQPSEPKAKKTEGEDGEEKTERRSGGGKGLSPPLDTRTLLSVVNRADYWLTQVTKSGPNGYPIVRLVSKAEYEARAEERAKESEAKAAAEAESKKGKVQADLKLKEIRFSWNISDYDLRHKLERLVKESRRKGHKLGVEVRSAKLRSREFYLPHAEEERAKLLAKIEKMVHDDPEDEHPTGFQLIKNKNKERWQGQVYTTTFEPTGPFRA